MTSPSPPSPNGGHHYNGEIVSESRSRGDAGPASEASAGPARHEIKIGVEEQGVILTWDELRVTASSGRKGASLEILSGVTGYAQPGEVLAIMGPSGCGKSTLLDALAGRLGSSMTQSGCVLVNGRRQALAFGTSAYVTQDDSLVTTLTIREAVYYSAQLQLPDSMTKFEKKERAENTIREMGLQDVMDTRIGGRSSKGISSGQKRRVSICIEILMRPKLLFLDEPTSGLDSAASYHVMNRIVNLARQYGRTIITSIHQPSNEVFELFDNLYLLSYGKTIYFGPTSMTSEFFATNGFPCPSLRNPSDHYLRTINKDFDKEIEVEYGAHKATTSEAINTLINSYKLSNTCHEVEERVAKLSRMDGDIMKKGSQASFASQSIVLTKRSFLNMYRDPSYYWLRFAVYFVLSLCIGTNFHDIGHSYASIRARSSMLAFVTGFWTFMSIGGFPSFVEDMKIFRRERLNGHYGAAAFVIGNTLSSTPFLGLASIIPGLVAYYLVGLRSDFGHFIFFALVLYMCMLLVESLMMIVASIVPDFLMGIIIGAGIQGIMMLSCGFFRFPNELPKPVWRYPIYYIAFHKYAIQGYYKNEFIGMTFPSNQVVGATTISGMEIVRDVWQMEVGYSKWVDLTILLAMVILYRIVFLIVIKTIEKAKPILRVILCHQNKL